MLLVVNGYGYGLAKYQKINTIIELHIKILAGPGQTKVIAFLINNLSYLQIQCISSSAKNIIIIYNGFGQPKLINEYGNLIELNISVKPGPLDILWINKNQFFNSVISCNIILDNN